MLNNGYQSVQELHNDRNLWARQCFNQLAHNTPSGRATEMCSDIYQRLACSAPQISTLDDLARKLSLPQPELDLLWLLACCELDSTLATVLRHGYERPALPANVARQLVQASAGAAAAVVKIDIHRLCADGLIEITPKHLLRLVSRLLQRIARDPATSARPVNRPETGPNEILRNRYPRGTTQPGYAATAQAAPVSDESAAWLANLRRAPAAATQPTHDALLCVGVCRVR
ncbi:MAG: hypothetical protein KBG15_03750 [Kofleriaceae bacterium]|nr:hypothetical protein [Kofleriaceae bacterium]